VQRTAVILPRSVLEVQARAGGLASFSISRRKQRVPGWRLESLGDFPRDLTDFGGDLMDFGRDLTDLRRDLTDSRRDLIDFRCDLTDLRRHLIDFCRDLINFGYHVSGFYPNLNVLGWGTSPTVREGSGRKCN
jgi:hypothetical protein